MSARTEQGEGWIIGRSPDAQLRVNDEYASPRHARVWRDEHSQAWVEDLGSTNGTWLTRPRLGAVRVYGPTKLFPGDEIRVGRTTVPWSVDGSSLTRQEVETLATFNAECSRGLVHTPEWMAKMAALQERFDGASAVTR